MKNLIIVIAFLFISCKPASTEPVNDINTEPTSVLVLHKCPDPIIIRDTIYLTKQFDSLQIVIKNKNDSLFVERYRLERVKYYNRIAQNNPSQMKFLVGWINRAVK